MPDTWETERFVMVHGEPENGIWQVIVSGEATDVVVSCDEFSTLTLTTLHDRVGKITVREALDIIGPYVLSARIPRFDTAGRFPLE